MSIQFISTVDNITINETLKDDMTIYEYVNEIVQTMGENVKIIMEINTGDRLITMRVK